MPNTTYAVNLFLDHPVNRTFQWARSRSSKPLYKHVQGKMLPSAGLHASGCPYEQLSLPQLRGRAVDFIIRGGVGCGGLGRLSAQTPRLQAFCPG